MRGVPGNPDYFMLRCLVYMYAIWLKYVAGLQYHGRGGPPEDFISGSRKNSVIQGTMNNLDQQKRHDI